MSGLILPGKGGQSGQGGEGGQGEARGAGGPESGQGGLIELPSGFGRKREEPRPDSAAPAATPAPEAPAPAPEAPTARGGAADFLFPPQAAQIQCPACGTPYVVPIFSIVDLGANPELKAALLGGQVNMAVCPNCGAGGPLSAPLLVHYPEKQFLGVVIPAEARINDVQRQRMIGDLTQTLMRKLPAEARKGYMLQPKQYTDWNRFMEQLWEFEGVTAEMLRRQRAQTELLQSLLTLADDPKALEIALGRSGDLVDRQFFTLLDRMLMMVSQQGTAQDAERFLHLRSRLLEMTPAGKEVAALQERVRALVGRITPGTSRADLLDLLLEAYGGPDGRDVAGAIVLGVAPAFDYQFLVELSDRLEKSEDDEESKRLEAIRELVLAVQEQQRASRQAMAQQAQQVLQEVLQAIDTDEALRQYADYLDETFLSLLAANIQKAEQNKSTGAARRFRQIYDAALRIMQEEMPPEVRLINELVAAPDKAALNAVIDEHRAELTPELLDAFKQMEDQVRAEGRKELADRMKSVRGQIQLRR